MSLSKLFQRIIWHNNNTPAINEDNLNAMSKAIDDIDDRVILIGDDVVTVIPQIQAYLEQAESIVEAVEELSQNPPYIGANGNWYVFDTTLEAYKDSGVDASITVDIADITMIAEGAQPYVTNTGTSTDPIFHLFLPRSPQGATGNGIANIAKTGTQGLVDTYTITMTDGTTYTFTVTNGQGMGDMTKSVYDSTNAVADAGGITDYVEGEVVPILNVLGAKNLLPNKATSRTVSGITFTVNSDGTVSVSGTATNNAYLIFPIISLKKGTYIISGCPDINQSETKAFLYVGSLSVFDYGSGASFTLSSDNDNINVIIRVNAGVSFSSAITFKPMIRLASIADSTYVPYSMTNQQLTPYAQAQNNPNLLDNPWFTVNQRGQSSYNTLNAYTVDRWFLPNNADNLGSVNINADGSLSLDNTNGTAQLYFRQILTTTQANADLYKSLLGKTVTLSILYTDGTIESATGVVPSNPSDWTAICNIPNSAKLKGGCALQMNNGSTLVSIGTWDGYSTENIRAVKLELGSVSTLAQDTAPDYGLELLKCQMSTVDSSDAYANRNISGAELVLEQSQTLSTSADTIYTFTNSAITANSAVDVYTTIYGINPSNVSVTSGSCVVTFPKQSTAQTMTCRIYVK